MSNRFFFNRRTGLDRRKGSEQRQNPRLDLSHKRRRKTDERRDQERSSAGDFYASNNYFSRSNLSSPDKH
ncbi:hypothetical protein [Oceanicoccus sagamiensis]|nr:hypothetical protein [Oceanicoccus sagamiensis]